MKRDTQEMAELYRQGKTMQEIADIYGIIKQAVHARFARAGIRRRYKYQSINKERLQQLYEENVSIAEIAKLLGADREIISQALSYYKIPKRGRLKAGGKHADFLRTLEIGATVQITLDVKNPHAVFHRSAANIGIKITVRSSGDKKFNVTRKPSYTNCSVQKVRPTI